MPKKKKTTRKKKVDVKPDEHASFWAQSGAVGMMLLAILLVLGGFGTGGPAPVDLFHGVYWTLGWAAYLAPVALIYWGVAKFTAEDHKIALHKLTSMLAAL